MTYFFKMLCEVLKIYILMVLLTVVSYLVGLRDRRKKVIAAQFAG